MYFGPLDIETETAICKISIMILCDHGHPYIQSTPVLCVTYVRVYVRTLVSGHIIGRAGASPPSRTSATEMFIYIYIIYDHLMCMREVYVKWFKGHHNRRYVSLLAMFT